MKTLTSTSRPFTIIVPCAVLLLPAVALPLHADQFGDFTYTDHGTYIEITDYPESAAGSVEIPATIGGKPVTSIGFYAFLDCTSLTSIFIPKSVTSIEDEAFAQCSGLTSVSIGGSVTSIGYGAFRGCGRLTGIAIPDNVTSIGNRAFEHCTSLTRATLGSSVESIGVYAFLRCNSLTSIAIPDSVTTIGNMAFSHCSSLTSISIPNSVTTIELGAFRDCTGLTSIAIPDSVTTIEDIAFSHCTSLSNIVIPDSVTSIGEEAFRQCTGLTSMCFGGNVPQFTGDVFGETSRVTVYCRPGTSGWDSTFAGRPTALWIPVILDLPTVTEANPLKLLTHSPPPTTVRVQRSTNLIDWEDWRTVSRDEGPSELHDTDASTTACRFYRGIEE